MIKKSISLLIVCTIAISVLTACSSNSKKDNSSDTSALSGAEVSEDAKSEDINVSDQKSTESLFSKINTKTLNGDDITGDDFKGDTLTILNIWATWCSPCVQELPHLQEISEYYADQGVKIVGVMQDGVDNNLAPLDSAIQGGKTLLADAGAEYTIILPDEVIMSEFINKMQFFPTTFFLDAEGNVIETIVGANDAEGWRNKIDEALKKIS